MDRLDRIEQILEQAAKERIQYRKEQEKLQEARQKEQDKLWAESRKEREEERKEREKAEKKQEKLREERQKEQDRLWAKYDKEREESRKEWAESCREWEKRWAESEERWDRLEQRMDSVNEQLGNIGINTGASAEELFYRSLKKELILGGIQYDRIERNVEDPSGDTEYDILLFNGTASAIVEVKSKAHPDKIQELVTKKVETFRKGYPELRGHKLYFGLASTITNDAMITEANKAGIYLLTQDGSHIEVVNTDARSF